MITKKLANTFEMYHAGLKDGDLDIIEEVRTHLKELVANGNEEFLDVLITAIEQGLATMIPCPECGGYTSVGHMEWSAIVCSHCGGEIENPEQSEQTLDFIDEIAADNIASHDTGRVELS